MESLFPFRQSATSFVEERALPLGKRDSVSDIRPFFQKSMHRRLLLLRRVQSDRAECPELKRDLPVPWRGKSVVVEICGASNFCCFQMRFSEDFGWQRVPGVGKNQASFTQPAQ